MLSMHDCGDVASDGCAAIFRGTEKTDPVSLDRDEQGLSNDGANASGHDQARFE